MLFDDAKWGEGAHSGDIRTGGIIVVVVRKQENADIKSCWVTVGWHLFEDEISQQLEQYFIKSRNKRN